MLSQTLLRYLQGVNLTLLALGATFTVVLSVVSLLLYWHLETAPQYRAQFESMRFSTLLFAGVMASAALAVWSVRRRYLVGWLAEVLLLLSIAITVQYFLPK